jgi:hypothetical protein
MKSLDFAILAVLRSLLVWNIYLFPPGRPGMRRSAAVAALLVSTLVLVASGLAANVHRSSPTKLTVWAGWSAGHELTVF